jgi:hypothetical protein
MSSFTPEQEAAIASVKATAKRLAESVGANGFVFAMCFPGEGGKIPATACAGGTREAVMTMAESVFNKAREAPPCTG